MEVKHVPAAEMERVMHPFMVDLAGVFRLMRADAGRALRRAVKDGADAEGIIREVDAALNGPIGGVDDIQGLTGRGNENVS